MSPDAGDPGLPDELPPVHTGVLDGDGLAELLADLTSLCEIDEIRGRTPPGSPPLAAAPRDLADAFERLREGELTAIQVRYRHADEAWLDTISRESNDYRIVRIADPVRPE